MPIVKVNAVPLTRFDGAMSGYSFLLQPGSTINPPATKAFSTTAPSSSSTTKVPPPGVNRVRPSSFARLLLSLRHHSCPGANSYHHRANNVFCLSIFRAHPPPLPPPIPYQRPFLPLQFHITPPPPPPSFATTTHIPGPPHRLEALLYTSPKQDRVDS